MLLRVTCVIILLNNLFILSSRVCLNLLQWTCYKCKEIWEVRLMFKMSWDVINVQIMAVKLGNKGSEYILMFPLSFQFSMFHKAVKVLTDLLQPLVKNIKHSYFFLTISSHCKIKPIPCNITITYHWSFLSVTPYHNICIFIKWKHLKYHAENPFHPVVKMFNF